MSKLRVLEVSGSFYDIGYQHGKAHYDAIHHFTEDRIELSRTEKWTGRTLSREAVLALAEACVPAHEAYSPELMEELRGTADATGLSLAELIVNNGFTDFIDTVYAVGDITAAKNPAIVADNCTAFLVPPSATDAGQGFFGQTWDMHASATPHVMLLHGKSDTAPDFLSFTITGCIGMIGMNAAGIAVGINNIMARHGQIGVIWNFVVRKILMQDNLDDALACITDAPLAGAHNYLLMDKHGNGYNVEGMPEHKEVTKLDNAVLAHTNHCVIEQTHAMERERPAASQASSAKRLHRAGDLLAQRPITLDTLKAITRDEEAICVRESEPMHVESCGAAIMSPSTGEFHAVWGLPSENEYERFVI
ncbi:MAG: C45 family autoproteolytic acyltransferase/hydrolase [Aggregatilineales bacterium]